jgi:azurin
MVLNFFLVPFLSLSVASQNAPPRILLDQPLRAVEYQLGRLTNEELILVERKDSDVKYRPVYFALLTRKGLAKSFRDEAVAAIVKLDGSSTSRVLLEGLGKVPAEDAVTARAVAALLLAQPVETLRRERDTFVKAIDVPSPPVALRAAYAAAMIADGDSELAWKIALAHDGQLPELLRGVAYLPAGAAGDALRAQLVKPVAALASESSDESIRVDALDALGWTRRDEATFAVLAREVRQGSSGPARAAAIRSLRLMPESAWPADAVEPLARAIVTLVGKTPPEGRTDPATIDAIQLGERLAATLPGETGRAVRRDLRALGVQVVEIAAVPEQLTYNVKWFVVEAGKPVQIVLSNPDAMPHNLIVGRPGSLQEIGAAGAAMPMSADPNVKPFVPALPSVLFSTRLLQGGETERLGFNAPATPGEYIYVCTFPGHWVRMYGVMLVVTNVEAWEAAPTTPIDPMTGKPFTSRR